jgi:predicted ATPase/DNA-binding CsgD family transcriptional regulator
VVGSTFHAQRRRGVIGLGGSWPGWQRAAGALTIVAGAVELMAGGVHPAPDMGGTDNVVALVLPDAAEQRSAPRPPDGFPNNLPAELTSFVGRKSELEQLREALEETRLLTLTGAGGAGKTRLALRLADGALERFPGGAWWVDLAPVADPQLVGEALAAALGVQPLPMMTALEATCARLAGSRALVVLDNCEHLLAACAGVAEALLCACREAVVIATSRASLGVAGETHWRVPSLSLPASERDSPQSLGRSDAARLFVERARKVRPGLAAIDDNAAAVTKICRELDGLPLAIELAAARARMMSVEQIAARLADRFRLLTGGTRSALPRQQTLRASVDWSHELLEEPERVLLRRLAVFAGGFTLELAEAVCADEPLARDDILDLLASLVDQSLVVAEHRAAAVRYRMLETVRQYARERLGEAGEADGIADRHRDAMLALAERAAPQFHGPTQREWLAELDGEAANLGVALDRAAATAPERALRLCVALTFWWKQRGMLAQAERAFAAALEAGEPAPSPVRAHALWGRGYIAAYAGRYEDALGHTQPACAMAEAVGDRSALARALMMIGFIQMFPDPLGGRETSTRARDIARACGDDWAWLTAELNVAYTHLNRHELDDGERVLERAMPLSESLGYLELQAWYWIGKCYRPWAAADHAELIAFAERALGFARAAGEPTTESLASGYLAHLELARGAAEAAAERMQAAYERVVAAGAGLALGWTVAWRALAQAALGDVAAARPALENLVSSGLDHGFMLAHVSGYLAEVQRIAGEASAAAASAAASLEVGQRVGNRVAITWAQEVLGRLAAERAEWARAERLLHQALGGRIERGMLLFLPQTFDALAEVAAGVESHEEAARTLGIASRLRADLGLARPAPDATRLAQLEEALRRALGDDAYALAHRQGTDLPLDQAVTWVRGARGRRKRPDRGWDSLTPTELRVAGLIAEGLTNPQIGERMFISRATVKAHLSHIYAKLDIATRSELAAEATRRAPLRRP